MGWVMVGLVSLVLLVAATNLANLTLGRGANRRHELAVRRALGATAWTLMREPLIESGFIALAGCGLALIFAQAILVYVRDHIPASVFDIPTTLAPSVVLVALAGAFLALIVFGLWPAMLATRPDVRSALIGSTGGGATMRWRTRRRGIISQVAISAMFLSLAATCIRQVVSKSTNDSGVDFDRLAITVLSFETNHWDEARARGAADRILGEARRTTGFAAVALASGLPFGITGTQMTIATPDVPVEPDGHDGRNAYVISATPEIFRVLGVPIVRGRGFDDRDTVSAPLVAVISGLASKTLFGESNAIGRHIRVQPYAFDSIGITGGMLTVVGIASDTDSPSQGRRQGLVVYVPFAQQYTPSLHVVVRAAGSGAAAVGPLQALVRKVEPELASGVSGPGAYLLALSTLGLRIIGGVATTLGAVVLVLAMAGLFGLVMQLVSTRTREFGIRQALGATRRDIVRLVLRDGIRPVRYGVIVGLLFGVLGRVVLHRMVPATLSGVDWLAFSVVPVSLVAAALLACYLPARRAASVDASIALRDQ